MRAFLVAVGAVVALGVLAACGGQAAPAASSHAVGAGHTSQQATLPSKVPPETPSVVAETTPPVAGKPRNPSDGKPPVTVGPDGPVVPAGVTEVPPSQVDSSALPNYVEYGNKVWAFDDGFSLQFFAAASSSCTGVQATVVDQGPDSVKIVVRSLDSPQGGRPDDGPCAMVMTPAPVTVTLDSPLRDRKILLSAGR
jgi:hypothetical protein